MKTSDLVPLQNSRAKYFYAFLAGFGLFLILASSLLNIENWFGIDDKEFIQYSKWIVAVGLFLMAFSKEKNEDERIQLIRFKAMKMILQLLLTILLVLNLSAVTKPDFAIYYSLEIIIGCLIFYHFMFHYALIYNPVWAFSDKPEKPVKPISPKYYLAFIIIQLAGLLFLLLLKS